MALDGPASASSKAAFLGAPTSLEGPREEEKGDLGVELE